ncbi:MAG: BamA/TamA family outer membrane protein [Myxococcota bacterium]
MVRVLLLWLGLAVFQAAPGHAQDPNSGAEAGSGDTPPDDTSPDDTSRDDTSRDDTSRDDDTPPVEAAPSDAPSANGEEDREEEAEPEGPGREPAPEEDAASAEASASASEESGDRDRIRYELERVEIEGNTSTSEHVIRRYVPLEDGQVLDVEDPAIESIRWRLLGTGFFEEVELRLRRGTARGKVILVIEVEETNTIIVEQLAFGLSQGVARTTDSSNDLLPYGGISIAETNLLGLGMELSLAAMASSRQQGAKLRFTAPVLFGSDFSLRSTLYFNNGREFFGDDPLVAVSCPPMMDPDDECPPEVEARNAVVFYKRYGWSLGTGHSLGTFSHYTLDWQADVVDVGLIPDAASELRGTDVVPIDFHIENNLSFVSTIRLGLHYDRRDDPGITSEGFLLRFRGMVGTRLFGSDYTFLRLQVLARHWVPLPFGRVRFGAFAGAIFGEAPFFYRFYASDLTDLVPSRLLEMNIDNRRPPNFFNTAIAEMNNQDLAARVDVEYGFPLYRGGTGIREIEAYVLVGLYALAQQEDISVGIPGYDGVSRFPIDFTFDVGIRADTSVGVFQLGFSNLLGFVPIFSESTP